MIDVSRIVVSPYIIYESISEAARALDVRAGNIHNVLTGRQRRTGGYRFRYSEASPC